MKLNDFKFNVDKVKVPEYGAEPRDAARLMVLDRKNKTISHQTFSDIHKYFDKGDCLVYNNTKVFPARLKGRKEKTDAEIEVFLLRELQPENMLWDVLVEPARKIRIGNKLYFGDDLVAEVVDNTTSRGRTIRFLFDDTNEELYEKLDQVGEMPLPPYIKREPVPEDKQRYQSIFAKERGAVAAPGASMHFTPELVDKLTEKGVILAPVTLHIGWGTFRPVEVEDLTKHRMDSEYYFISEESAALINQVRTTKQNKVVASGTTAVRAIESSIMASGLVKPVIGWTDKFIYPPYDFKLTEGLITNFHRPESTLLMLTAAFSDFDFLMHAYEEAVKHDYGFYAFGDAMMVI
jgi:S-adenosylmethionine:tRNA ribosyltransferase-isomerase